ncbi:MAG: hypothetical protein IH996_01565 [Proteobacteria bacterium]|nr:hypothetical protein [Pseudomonadota bacterium]
MKAIRQLSLPSWRWLVCTVALGISVALVVPVLGQTITVTTYSSTGAWDKMAFDSANNLWASARVGSESGVIRLDPATDVLTTWTHPNPTVFGTFFQRPPIGVRSTGEVWVGADAHINRLIPGTGEVTSWPLAGRPCGDSVYFDTGSNAWFGQQVPGTSLTSPSATARSTFSDLGILARLNPSTNTITEWEWEGNCPEVVGVDTSGNILVCERDNFNGKVGMLDPATNVITKWNIPDGVGDCRAGAGRFWFVSGATEILALDPATNGLTVWTCSLGCTLVMGVAPESASRVWLTLRRGLSQRLLRHRIQYL